MAQTIDSPPLPPEHICPKGTIDFAYEPLSWKKVNNLAFILTPNMLTLYWTHVRWSGPKEDS